MTVTIYSYLIILQTKKSYNNCHTNLWNFVNNVFSLSPVYFSVVLYVYFWLRIKQLPLINRELNTTSNFLAHYSRSLLNWIKTWLWSKRSNSVRTKYRVWQKYKTQIPILLHFLTRISQDVLFECKLSCYCKISWPIQRLWSTFMRELN